MLSDNAGSQRFDIEYPGVVSHAGDMKKIIASSVALALFISIANPAFAGCYADYKAKRDNPLRLHYGVIELSDAACRAPSRAKSEISAHLARENWQLLNVISVFDDDGLKKRRKSAGKYFLRY